VDAVRMSFGDHLEELRSRLIRALLGVAVCAVGGLFFAKELLAWILQPALVVLRARGQEAVLQVLSPPDTFIIYLKVGLLSGVIIATPWVLHQIWQFVASGLYAHERRFVRTFAPVSVVLFGAGVLFMYFLVLPVVLIFFVGFSMGIPMPRTQPSWLQRLMIPSEAPTSQPASVPEPMAIPLVSQPPEDAAPGDVWFDTSTDRLQLMTADGIRSLPMRVADTPNPVRSEFGLNFYVSFVLSLALAFGLAFELPVAVVFLVLTRIVPVALFSRSRRYVIFGIFVAAAILTPPDVVSQILLAIPMLLLFEGGLFFGRMIERNR